MEEIQIKTEFIKLQQAIKLAGIIGQGSDIKILIAEQLVFVNGILETQRGKKIYPNSIIEIKNLGKIKVISEE